MAPRSACGADRAAASSGLQRRALASAAVGHRDPAARDRGERAKRSRSRRALARAGLLVPAIRPPTVPRGTARLRIRCPRRTSSTDVERLAAALNVAERRSDASAAEVRDVVLLHGWGMHRARVLRRARRRGSRARYRVHALDLPGYGARAAVRAVHARRAGRRRWRARAPRALPRRRLVAGRAGRARLGARAPRAQVARLVLIATTPCFARRADWPHAIEPRRAARVRAARSQPIAAARCARFVALQAQGDARATHGRARAAQRARCATARPTRALAAGLAHPRARPTCARALPRDRSSRRWSCTARAIARAACAAARALAPALPRARLAVVRGAAHAPFVSRAAAASRRSLREFFDER